MSKKLKTIIAGAIVLVLLGAVLVTLVLTKKDDTAQVSSNKENEYLTLIHGLSNDVEYLKIKNATDEYTISRQAENRWGIPEIMEYEQDYSLYSVTLSQATNVIALDVIEKDASNLAKYGLENPSITFDIKFKDKDAVVIHVGATSSDGSVVYITKGNEKTVYIVSAKAFENLVNDRYMYVSKVFVPGFDSTNIQDIPEINEMTITRPDLPIPIKVEQFDISSGRENEAAQADIRMVKPYNTLLSTKSIENYIYGNFGIVATEIVTANPTPAQLKEYGFEQPTSVFEMKYGGSSSIKVTTGKAILSEKKEIVSYYAKREGINQIYIINATDAHWMNVQPADFVSSMQILPHILDIDSINIMLDNKTNNLQFIKGSVKTDAKLITSKLNGKDIDVSNAKLFLQLILMTEITGFGNANQTDKPVASLQYNYVNGTKDLLEFYVASDLTCTIVFNKENAFVSRGAYIDALKKQFINLQNGKEVDITW